MSLKQKYAPRVLNTRLFLAKKKGFDKKKQKTPAPTSPVSETTPSTPSTSLSSEITEQKKPQEQRRSTGGEATLQRLRAEAAKQKEDELRKIREIKSVDEFIRDDPNAAVIPEKVAMRMGARMLPFVGIPLFGGMAIFVGFWYFATVKGVVFQTGLVAAITIAALAVGLMGITYSVMSASWDAEIEGSALGVDEFKTNVDNIKLGLQRSRENAILREKMAGLPEEEINKALAELDKRDERAKMKRMSLEEKMNKEME